MEKGWDRKKLILWVPLAFALFVLYKAFAPVNGFIGHDFVHYYARILIGDVHFWKNGFSIPHFTANLCGGIPFLADPQAVYYSIPQWLSFFIEPYTATVFTYLIFYIVGYLGIYFLCRNFIMATPRISHFAALAYTLNGFSYGHLLVGHTTHHQYMLIPWMIYLMLTPKPKFGWKLATQASFFSLMSLYMVWSGAIHMIIVFLVTAILFVPFVYLKHREKKQLKNFLVFVGLCTVAVILGSSGKFVAASLFAKHFVKSNLDSSGMGMLQLFWQYFFFLPGSTPGTIVFGHYAYGPWEYIGFFTRLMIPALLAFFYFYLQKPVKKRFVLLAVYLYLTATITLIATAGPINLHLPGIRAYHNPIKIMGAFIPLFALVLAYVLKNLAKTTQFKPASDAGAMGLFLVGAIFLIGEFNFSSKFLVDAPNALGEPYVPLRYEALKASVPAKLVSRVVARGHYDADSISDSYSNLSCYEPLFGYRHEAMRPQLVEGPPTLTRDGYFNINHPACFLYGKGMGCDGWDRVPASQGAEVERFIAGEPMTEWVPLWHRMMLWSNFIVIFLLMLVPFGPRLRALKK